MTLFKIHKLDVHHSTDLTNFFLHSFNLFCLKSNINQVIPYSIRQETVKLKSQKFQNDGKILVATDPDSSKIYYAYLAYREYEDAVVLYFGYTKYAFRNYGIMKRLLKEFNEITENKKQYYFLDVRKSRYNFIFDSLPRLIYQPEAV